MDNARRDWADLLHTMKELDDTDKQILESGYRDRIADIVGDVESVAQNFQRHACTPTNVTTMVDELRSAAQKLEVLQDKILQLEIQP